MAGYRRSGYSRGRRRIGSRNLRRRGNRGNLNKNIIIVAVASVLIAAGAICLILFTGGGESAAVAQAGASAGPTSVATVTPVPTVDLSQFSGEYNYEGVDPSILAGLAGTDESLFSDEGDEMLALSGVKIGITVGGIQTENDKLLLSKMEEATGDAVRRGLVYEVYCYDAGGDFNQQLQDLRSIIKNDVDVIIVGSTSAENFRMVSYMAAQEGIPLVAYEAPVETGYAANVISNQASWGQRYGSFIADNLPSGNIVEILGSETSGIDVQRKAAIESAFSENTGISLLNTSYASWNRDTANETMDSLLEQNTQVDAVVTEEGMAAGILDAFIEAGRFPKVMCGDATAGFIKKWYALKNGGIVIAPPQQGHHTPTPELLLPQAGEFAVCAQPAPGRAAAIAFDVALRLANGETLKSEGIEYTYSAVTFITDDNLALYYEMVKDMPDSYTISDPIDFDAAGTLFNTQE